MSDFDVWRRRQDHEDIALDADQTEWAALRDGAVNVDVGLRDGRLGGELSQLEDREERAGQIAEELGRRAAVLGEAYPFKIHRNSLSYSKSRSGVYEFCLSISFVESLSDRAGQRFQIAFERLVRDVLKCHLGNGATAIRIGVPSDGHEHRPTSMKGVVEQLQQMSAPSEWCWEPDEGFPVEPLRQDVGDLGIDVVAWKPLTDGRGGNLFLLGQCACGLTDWDDKFDEPNKGRLASWIKRISYVPFVKVFAVPFHIANNALFGEVTRRVEGITLDRARLVSISDADGHRTIVKRAAPVRYRQLVDDAIGQRRDDVRARKRRRRKAAAGQRSQ